MLAPQSGPRAGRGPKVDATLIAMTESRVEIKVVLEFGHRVELVGSSGDQAVPLIEAKFAEAGHPLIQDEEPYFVVSPVGGRSESHSFVVVRAGDTLADLRLIAGPGDYHVVIEFPGFGGDAEFFVWELSDLIEFGGDLLEAYGAIELGARAVKSLRRYRHRSSRRLAEDWIRSGDGVPPELRDLVRSREVWGAGDIMRELGLDAGAATRLMNECGFRWDTQLRVYRLPNDLDAVN